MKVESDIQRWAVHALGYRGDRRSIAGVLDLPEELAQLATEAEPDPDHLTLTLSALGLPRSPKSATFVQIANPFSQIVGGMASGDGYRVVSAFRLAERRRRRVAQRRSGDRCRLFGWGDVS